MRLATRHITRLDPTRPLSVAIAQILCRIPSDVDLASSDDVSATNHADARYRLGRTMLVVPGGRLARAVEKRLLELSRAEGAVLEAPTIVTPLMLFGRFIVPERPMLSRLGAQASWRETLERIASTDAALLGRIAAAFGSPADLPERLRPRLAAQLAKLSTEIASAMHTFTSVRAALEEAGASIDPQLLAHWHTLEACARVRSALLDEAGVGDRDDALRDALLTELDEAAAGAQRQATARVASSIGFDRVVILFADPEPVHRALFRVLEERGVSIELCVHRMDDASPAQRPPSDQTHTTKSAPAYRDVADGPALDREGFPSRQRWANHTFGTHAIADADIRVGEGPNDAASEVIAALRSIPAPRRSDEIAIMAPDDESRRAIERALGEVGTRAARVESRIFAATRLGTLLARLEDLLREESLDAFAAYIRHPDVASSLGRLGLVGSEHDVATYRVATIAERWRDGVVDARGSKGVQAVRDAVETQVRALTGSRAISDWARPLRAFLESVVQEGGRADGSEDAREDVSADVSADVGADVSTDVGEVARLRKNRAFENKFENTFEHGFDDERVQSVVALDRVLREISDIPAAFKTAISCSDAIRVVREAVDRTEIRGVRWEPGISLLQWLDAGIADEPHLILAGFTDGVVPEGDVADTLMPDAIRRELGLLSSLRRAARDAWILDGILERARARRAVGLPASVQFVLARRSTAGDPLRPSRYLLRVESAALPSRVATLFPSERERPPAIAGAGSSIAFPICPKVDGSSFRTISVTAFRTYLKCPYLFQLQNDSRLRLENLDESAAELDARSFGNLLHEAVEAWGHEEVARAQPTTDRAAIEKSVLAHLDAAIARMLPAHPAAAVRVQIEVLRARLQRFAELQAQEAEAGWHVRFVELSFDEQSGPLLVAKGADASDPTRALRLVGRIDRVDVHRETGAWRALDYKTGSAGETPTAAHLTGRKVGARTWKDLQLPLYRHLLAEGKHAIAVAKDGLGYINLAASAEKSGFRMLECTSEEFDAAFEEARRVVAGVLQGEFTPAARAPISADDPLAAVWGLGLRMQVLGQVESLGGDGSRGDLRGGASDRNGSGGDA